MGADSMGEIEIRRYGKTMVLTIWKSREMYIGASAMRAMGNPRRVAPSIDPATGDLKLRATEALSGYACRAAGGAGAAFTADSILTMWAELFGVEPSPGKYRARVDDGVLTVSVMPAGHRAP